MTLLGSVFLAVDGIIRTRASKQFAQRLLDRAIGVGYRGEVGLGVDV